MIAKFGSFQTVLNFRFRFSSLASDSSFSKREKERVFIDPNGFVHFVPKITTLFSFKFYLIITAI